MPDDRSRTAAPAAVRGKRAVWVTAGGPRNGNVSPGAGLRHLNHPAAALTAAAQ